MTYVKNWINSIESQYQGFVLIRDNFPVLGKSYHWVNEVFFLQWSLLQITYIIQSEMISGYSLHNFPVDFLDFITEEQILVQVFNSGWINLMKSE